MKRITLAIVLTCCTLALAAQDVIRVKYQGANPTISDFVGAFLSAVTNGDEDDEDYFPNESLNAVGQAWIQQQQGLPLDKGETLTIDQKNGYVRYESRWEKELLRVEMCYWNEADKKHKLFACSVASFTDDKYSPGQFDDIQFYRYDNATKKMSFTRDTGFDVEYGTDDGAKVSYALPSTGKDITVTYWYDNKTQLKTLKWNGHGFSF